MVSILINFWSSIKNNWKKKSAAQRTSAFISQSVNRKGERPHFLMPDQVLVLYKMQREHLCSCQCCQGGTFGGRQEHDSFLPYLVKSGDRLEQITPICRGEREG